MRHELQEQGYAPLPIDISRDELAAAIGSYMDFLELPSEYHAATVFDLTDRGDGDFGQFRRVANEQSARGIRPDNKDIFHFGSMTRQVVESRITGSMPADMKEFLNQTEDIYWAAQRTKRLALDSLDVAGKGLRRALAPEFGTINDVLRLIAYYPNDNALAQGHFDRSVATLAIGESHPGLRMAPGQNGLRVNANTAYMRGIESRLQPVDHHSGEAKFFLGAGWNRLPAHLRQGSEHLPLAFHDVINNGQKVGKQVMRWAAVMFITPHTQFPNYQVPTQPETRPYKQLGRLCQNI